MLAIVKVSSPLGLPVVKLIFVPAKIFVVKKPGVVSLVVTLTLSFVSVSNPVAVPSLTIVAPESIVILLPLGTVNLSPLSPRVTPVPDRGLYLLLKFLSY